MKTVLIAIDEFAKFSNLPIEILESLIMITFVNYETAGYFGHYRTLINQLLSHLYGGVSIFPVTLTHSCCLNTY